jgi:hypothetical protein
MQNAIPLLVAFLGALFGTYFAILKSRNERLWTDRYETLVSIVEVLEIIKAKFQTLQADELNLRAFTPEERSNIQAEWLSARQKLNSKITRVRILFKENEIVALLAAHHELDKAILNALEESGPDLNALFNKVWTCANDTANEAIVVARSKCL